jgi:Arc/MetJ-type ribon-helix-helix transcriptional regulator
MGTTKSEKISVSMDSQILEAIQEVANEEFAGNRSAYLESVLAADLEKRGAHPASPSAKALAKAKALIEAHGPELADAMFEEIAARRAQEVSS